MLTAMFVVVVVLLLMLSKMNTVPAWWKHQRWNHAMQTSLWNIMV